MFANSFRSLNTVLSAILLIFSASFTQAATILVHGDSLSAGYGMTPEQTWVSLLQQKLGDKHQVINTSISGETSKGGLDRLEGLLEEHNPSILILELGANDGLRGYPIKQMRSNLSNMIQLAQSQGVDVAILGIRLPPNFGKRYTEPFYNVFLSLSEEFQTGYLPFLLDGVALYSEYMQEDQLHPNVEAQPIILDNVWPIIEPMLPAS